MLLGTRNDLDYKLDRARYVLTNADGKVVPLPTRQTDFSHVSAGSTRKIYFAQGSRPCPPVMLCGKDRAEEPDTSAAEDTAADGAEDAAAAQLRTIRRQCGRNTADRPRRMTANTKKTPCDKMFVGACAVCKLEQLLKGALYLAQGSLDTEISDIHLRQPQGGTGPFVRVHCGHPGDSHEFAADCAAKGVSALVIQHDIDLSAMPGVTVVKVESSRYAMA